MILTIVGTIVIGIANFSFGLVGADTSLEKQIIGFIINIVSLVFISAVTVTEEKLYTLYDIHPLQMVGKEGIWGIFGCGLTIAILNFVKCPEFMQGACIQRNGDYYFEDIELFSYQLKENYLLIISFIIWAACLILYNFCIRHIT